MKHNPIQDKKTIQPPHSPLLSRPGVPTPPTQTTRTARLRVCVCVSTLPRRPSTVTFLADGVGVGVHYNTLIPWQRQPNPGNFASFKYGVIGVDRQGLDTTWVGYHFSQRYCCSKSMVQSIDDKPVCSM
jgi:hypothetical protein